MNKLPNEILTKIWEYDNTYKRIFNNCVTELNKILYYNSSIIVQVSDNVVDKNNFNEIVIEYKRIKNKYYIDDEIKRNKFNNKYLIIEYEIFKDKINEMRYVIHNNFYNFNQNIKD